MICIKEGKLEVKLKLIFLFLNDLTDNSLFKIIIATRYSVMYVYAYLTHLCVYIHIRAYIYLHISEVNDSNDKGWKELGLFCYYNVHCL